MFKRSRYTNIQLFTALALLLISPQLASRADIIFESATMGPHKNGGTSLSNTQTGLGSRFYIDQPVQVTDIGGHIVSFNQGTFYGAIISISGPDAYPIGLPLDSSEILASTVFALPSTYSSYDYRTPLSAYLEPGYYALVFGTDNL